MLLYAICISGCECFTFVSFSLSLHSLRFASKLFRSQPQWHAARANRPARNRRRRTSRRRFRSGKCRRIGLSLTWRSTTTTPSSLCTLTPWKRSRFSVATRFSSSVLALQFNSQCFTVLRQTHPYRTISHSRTISSKNSFRSSNT